MSIIPDPDELLVCPYDPVHRVAAKKFPYHLNKCRKQYGKFGEFKTCPFNARHVIPAPEYQYHMETCESKAPVDMEIAFEQSRNDTTGVIKGCTDIPKSPEWIKPAVTENWDEDEVAPAFLPQPLQNKPPENLPRPMPSRPLSRKSNDSSPINWFPPPGEKKSGRNFQSPRASRGRHISHINRGDEHLLATATPSFAPSPLNDEILDQDEFPPLSLVPHPRHSKRKQEPKLESHSPEIHSAFIPQTQPSVMTHPTQPSTAAQTLASFTPIEPTLSPQPQYPNQDQLSNMSSFGQPPPPQLSLISQNTSEPTQQANSLARPSLQNVPVYQPYFAPPTNPVSTPIPNHSYPPHIQSLPTAPAPMPQQSFSHPPPAPLTGTQNNSYNLQQQQQQHVPAQHYLPPQQEYLNPGMYMAPQATHAISPPVPNTLPPQQLHYNQPQFQTVPNHQLPYNQQTYPPQPQYANYPPSQYNPPQYVPQQYYNVPQYNAAIPNYQQMQPTTHSLAPGQLPNNPPYQTQYADSQIGSQISVQRPPGPGLISEKNRNLLQGTQNLPQAVPNDAYFSANSVPIKLAPAPQQPSLNAAQGMPWGDQSSVVSMGSQPPGTGRGRGRGLSPRASPKRVDHALPGANPTHQPPPFMHSIVPQMEQLHLANPSISIPRERDVSQFPQPPPHNFHSSQPLQPLPTNVPPHQQHTLIQQHSANPPHNFTANHIPNPSFRGSAPTQNPQTRLPSHIAPQTAQQPRFSVTKIQSLKNSLVKIALLEQKKEPHTEEEKELLKSKIQLLGELGEL